MNDKEKNDDYKCLKRVSVQTERNFWDIDLRLTAETFAASGHLLRIHVSTAYQNLNELQLYWKTYSFSLSVHYINYMICIYH